MKRFVCVSLLLLCLMLSACGYEAAVTTVVADAAPSESPAAAEKAGPESLQGSWSGVWEMYMCSGKWVELEGIRWKCWASIDDSGNILIWDEDIPKETGLARLKIEGAGDEFSVSGKFMDNSSGFESWTLHRKSADEGGGLVLRGRYSSEENGDFSFAVYLEKD